MSKFWQYLSYEDKEHIKVVNFIRKELPGIIAFHICNDGKKTPYEQYRHFLMGALKGCPDFAFLYPKFKSVQVEGRGFKEMEYFGLFIELKAPEHERIIQKGKRAGQVEIAKGVPSREQIEMIKKLNKLRYKACICYGADAAISVIKEYFSLV